MLHCTRQGLPAQQLAAHPMAMHPGAQVCLLASAAESLHAHTVTEHECLQADRSALHLSTR